MKVRPLFPFYFFYFLHFPPSWVKIRLHTKNHLPSLCGSALKVCVMGGWVCNSILVFHFGPNQSRPGLWDFDMDHA